MTATQRQIVTVLEIDSLHGSTAKLRQHASQQLAEYRERLAIKARVIRPSPFSRFVDMLDNKDGATK